MDSNGDPRRKKLLSIGLSSFLLVGLGVGAIVFGLTCGSKSDEPQKLATSTKAVQAICEPTDYKETCQRTLSSAKSSDPKELVGAAFASAKQELTHVVGKSSLLKELESDPATAKAVADCRELFQDAADDLQRSFTEIGELDWSKIDKMLFNMKIWLSATVTYQETCLDGFENTTTNAGEKVRALLKTSMKMTSNGLAIVADMSALVKEMELPHINRRLLSATERTDENPLSLWMHHRRHLMHDVRREPNEGRGRYLKEVKLEDAKSKADVVVAKDGSGKYKTITEALKEVPKYGNDSFVIYVKEGVYEEHLVINKTMTHLVLVGDGPTKTRISGSENFADGTPTFKTATISVLGDFFMAMDIGFENTAGAIKHQAVALRVQSDQSIFYNCHMDGFQDTLYAHTYRQFYRDCRISGTIDFVFGDAASFFQNCTFIVRKPLDNQQCIVTAQGRKERRQPTGIILHHCSVVSDPDYFPVRHKNKAFLGRPWKEYSKTIIMESQIEDLIQPEGWLPWMGDFGLNTCYYGEYDNEGKGASLEKRVKWKGIKTKSIAKRVDKFMPEKFFGDDDWIKESGVPYDSKLSKLPPNSSVSDDDEDESKPKDKSAYSSKDKESSSSKDKQSSSSKSSSKDKDSSYSKDKDSSSSKSSSNDNESSYSKDKESSSSNFSSNDNESSSSKDKESSSSKSSSKDKDSSPSKDKKSSSSLSSEDKKPSSSSSSKDEELHESSLPSSSISTDSSTPTPLAPIESPLSSPSASPSPTTDSTLPETVGLSPTSIPHLTSISSNKKTEVVKDLERILISNENDDEMTEKERHVPTQKDDLTLVSPTPSPTLSPMSSTTKILNPVVKDLVMSDDDNIAEKELVAPTSIYAMSETPSSSPKSSITIETSNEKNLEKKDEEEEEGAPIDLERMLIEDNGLGLGPSPVSGPKLSPEPAKNSSGSKLLSKVNVILSGFVNLVGLV